MEEDEAFVVGWQHRVDLEIDGAVAGLEFVPAGDDAPGLALKRDHVEAVSFGYRPCGCDGCDGCEFSHRCRSWREGPEWGDGADGINGERTEMHHFTLLPEEMSDIMRLGQNIS